MISEEFGAGCGALARSLVRRTAALQPRTRERYEEEWLATLEERRTPLRQLLFALGIWRKRGVLRRQLEFEKVHLPPEVAAAKWFVDVMNSPSPMGIEERRHLVAWLKESPEHVVALLRTKQVYKLLSEERLKDALRKRVGMDDREISRTDEG
jgi:hypothetical protein